MKGKSNLGKTRSGYKIKRLFLLRRASHLMKCCNYQSLFGPRELYGHLSVCPFDCGAHLWWMFHEFRETTAKVEQSLPTELVSPEDWSLFPEGETEVSFVKVTSPSFLRAVPDPELPPTHRHAGHRGLCLLGHSVLELSADALRGEFLAEVTCPVHTAFQTGQKIFSDDSL